MSLVISLTGKTALLNTRLAYLATLEFRLYQNNYTPVVGSVVGDFTVATFNGYAGIVVGAYTAAVINGSNQGQSFAAPLLWTKTAGGVSNDIYGYYVVDPGGVLVYAEKNPAGPVTINTTGQVYIVAPQWSNDSMP